MDPHAGQPVVVQGPGLAASTAAMILVHGRNAGPENILPLAAAFPHPRFSYLAPAAGGRTWYPESFLSEIERNEPGLSSGLLTIDRVIAQVERAGIPRRNVILLGFSQGACLASEYAIRHAARLGGLVALSGGLIGPPGTRWDYPGDFAGTPMLFGCSDVDAHVPRDRVELSAAEFARRGASVALRIYPGMGHLVNEDELGFVRELVAQVGK